MGFVIQFPALDDRRENWESNILLFTPQRQPNFYLKISLSIQLINQNFYREVYDWNYLLYFFLVVSYLFFEFRKRHVTHRGQNISVIKVEWNTLFRKEFAWPRISVKGLQVCVCLSLCVSACYSLSQCYLLMRVFWT